MNHGLIDRRYGLHVIAASVLVALGASQATAQQIGQPEVDLPPLPTQEPERQDPFSDQSSQDSVLQQESGFGLEQDSEIRSADEDGLGGSGSLDQVAQENGELSTFIEAIRAAGMEESLTDGTPYTLFAPTNDAFEQMSGMSLDELMQAENREQLISILRAHIVADDVDETMARTLPQAQTIDGGVVSLSSSGDALQVGDAAVVDTGVQQGSLRVYAIDQVLEPTVLARAETGIEDDAESESQFDTQGDFGSERESDFGLDTERDPGSLLDTPERDDSLLLERDDPFDSEQPGAGRFDVPTERSGSESLLDRLGSQN